MVFLCCAVIRDHREWFCASTWTPSHLLAGALRTSDGNSPSPVRHLPTLPPRFHAPDPSNLHQYQPSPGEPHSSPKRRQKSQGVESFCYPHLLLPQTICPAVGIAPPTLFFLQTFKTTTVIYLAFPPLQLLSKAAFHSPAIFSVIRGCEPAKYLSASHVI